MRDTRAFVLMAFTLVVGVGCAGEAPPDVDEPGDADDTGILEASRGYESTVAPSATDVKPGQSVTFDTTFKVPRSGKYIVHLQLYRTVNGSWQLVDEFIRENQAFSGNQTRSYSFTWSVPATESPGKIGLSTGIYTPRWSTVHWKNHAATVTVNAANEEPARPVNSSAPTLAGEATLGATLTASKGSWLHDPTSYAYTWHRCESSGSPCQSFGPSTKTSYALETSDVGKVIKVTVTASNAAGSTSATSAASAVVEEPETTMPPPPPPPTSGGTVLFSARHEKGNLDEWWANYGGGMYNSGSYQDGASKEQAHGGSWSLRASISASSGSSGVRAFRWKESRATREAYYSAWFFIPPGVKVNGWWQIFQFKARSTGGAIDPFWYLEVESRADGSLGPKLTWWNSLPVEGPHKGESGGRQYRSTATIPVGRWFHIEAFLRQSNTFDGRITFWLDGVEIFDQTNVKTSYANCTYNAWCASNEWSINNYGSNLSPNPVTIYMDDAVISTGRVGPQ